MAEIKVPEFGDSIQEVQVFQWLKKPGEWVERDEDIVELESEKASQSLPAPVSGVLASVAVAEGEIIQVGAMLCVIDESASRESASAGQRTPQPQSWMLLLRPAKAQVGSCRRLS